MLASALALHRSDRPLIFARAVPTPPRCARRFRHPAPFWFSGRPTGTLSPSATHGGSFITIGPSPGGESSRNGALP